MIVVKSIRKGLVNIAALLTMEMLSGCIVIRGTNEEWRETEIAKCTSGTVVETLNLSFHQWSRDKYEIDDGSRIAIGFFPGGAEFDEFGYIGSKDDYPPLESRSWTEFVFDAIIGQPFCFCVPTIASLLITPFRENRASSWGIIGCHRWNNVAKKSCVIVEQGAKEDIAKLSDSDKREREEYPDGGPDDRYR